ncbi:hypothetical protein WG904_06500 [Pedobacter sp. Du54]|uniref:hypothetical protein n=1 Tax=Pedobacter anseongensis TaxID=3133439 RepID=UPI0030ACC31F
MRFTLRSLVLLDTISLLLLGWQIWAFLTSNFPEQPSQEVRHMLMVPMFILILMGAIGLFLEKKYGFVLYYIQFPFRLYLWVFSVGFITLIPEALEVFNDTLYDILFKACFVAEVIRLYLTIKIHRAK